MNLSPLRRLASGRNRLAWVLLTALGVSLALPGVGAGLFAQTPALVDLGAQPTFAWDHDGVNTTHYRFYQQAGTATPTKIGNDLAKPAAGGTVEMVYPVKFSAEGTFNLYVTAANVSTDPNVSSNESDRSAALSIQVKRAQLPKPGTPLNLRLVLKVAADGRVELYLAGVEPAPQ